MLVAEQIFEVSLTVSIVWALLGWLPEGEWQVSVGGLSIRGGH